MNKGEIIKDISTRVDFCIFDANTYLWAKCQKDFGIAEKVGGGNFVVLLSTFSTLDLLSYVNGLLNNKPKYSQNDITEFKEKLRLSKLSKFGIRPPKEGIIKENAKDLVKILIIESKDKTGITEANIDLLWKTRHKLTHEFNPKYIPAGSYPSTPNINFDALILEVKNRPLISKGSDNQDCIDVHAFNHKLRIMSDSVISKLETANEEIIQSISDWLTQP